MGRNVYSLTLSTLQGVLKDGFEEAVMVRDICPNHASFEHARILLVIWKLQSCQTVWYEAAVKVSFLFYLSELSAVNYWRWRGTWRVWRHVDTHHYPCPTSFDQFHRVFYPRILRFLFKRVAVLTQHLLYICLCSHVRNVIFGCESVMLIQGEPISGYRSFHELYAIVEIVLNVSIQSSSQLY